MLPVSIDALHPSRLPWCVDVAQEFMFPGMPACDLSKNHIAAGILLEKVRLMTDPDTRFDCVLLGFVSQPSAGSSVYFRVTDTVMR